MVETPSLPGRKRCCVVKGVPVPILSRFPMRRRSSLTRHALHGLLPPWKRLWDLSTHLVLCLSILLPLLLPCTHPALLRTNCLADSPSADDDQMIISKWRRATYQAVDPHHSSRGYQITSDTVESHCRGFLAVVHAHCLQSLRLL